MTGFAPPASLAGGQAVEAARPQRQATCSSTTARPFTPVRGPRLCARLCLATSAHLLLLRPTLCTPQPILRLLDRTRSRVSVVSSSSAGKNRVEKLLEDAQIKLSVVASDIFGVSGRDMMAALIAGQRDPQVLAQMARARMRVKIPQPQEAFVGHFDDHHAFLLAQMLARIDTPQGEHSRIGGRIETGLAPFDETGTPLDGGPGGGDGDRVPTGGRPRRRAGAPAWSLGRPVPRPARRPAQTSPSGWSGR